MRLQALKGLKQGIALLLVSLLTVLSVRAWDKERGPPLEPWHTWSPDELTESQLEGASWSDYLEAEQRIFAELRTEVTEQLPAAARVLANRYFEGSPIYPGGFATDWNRSFILEPEGTPIGAMVFLHGLTDSPYSGRHVAGFYRDHGFLAVVIRLPGHGTVPGGLGRIQAANWSAAVKLAVREARHRVPGPRPLHIVGYSNGGTLAMKYALDAIENPGLPQADQLVLISPMVGVTNLARFAGVLGWPAVLPRFAKTAWISITPEFNPFKYNSFPINGARQSSLVTRELQAQLTRAERTGRLAELPPILTFQSVVDATVSTQAIVSGLYQRLPPGSNELVLFDLNRREAYAPLLRDSIGLPSQLLPEPPRVFRSTIIGNASPDTGEVVERVIAAGEITERRRQLGLAYPGGVFSVSHVALPFPVSDSLYGLDPGPEAEFGIRLGTLAPRGERGTLIVPMDSLVRINSNPFFSYLLERIGETIAGEP